MHILAKNLSEAKEIIRTGSLEHTRTVSRINTAGILEEFVESIPVLGCGYPVYAIPFGYTDEELHDLRPYICLEETTLLAIWDNLVSSTDNVFFHKLHIIHIPPSPGPK